MACFLQASTVCGSERGACEGFSRSGLRSLQTSARSGVRIRVYCAQVCDDVHTRTERDADETTFSASREHPLCPPLAPERVCYPQYRMRRPMGTSVDTVSRPASLLLIHGPHGPGLLSTIQPTLEERSTPRPTTLQLLDRSSSPALLWTSAPALMHSRPEQVSIHST